MKRLLPLIQVLLTIPVICNSQTALPKELSTSSSSANLFSGSPTENIPDKNWQSAAQDYIKRSEYYFKDVNGAQVVANRKQKLSFQVSGSKIVTSPILFNEGDHNWTSSLELLSVTKCSEKKHYDVSQLITSNDQLTYRYDGLDIEYINNESGLRQNFIVNEKPSGASNLQVYLKISGDLKANVKNGESLLLTDKKSGKTILEYDGLKVWDANHVMLKASMELNDKKELVLKIDDANATYPVTVDPLTHSPEWITSADGVLPGLLTGLQLQIDALYGYSLAGVGDVNNDSYDDVVVGAPGAIDIIIGTPNVTVAGAGAVFVYFGSSSGLPVAPSRILRSTTPVANALFGFSVAGGNVVGLTTAGSINSDIIVGAPGESYVASVSGIPNTATVTAGKVYIFNGATLASGPSAPTASLFLNGTGLFSRGVLGLLGTNIAVNALFGFSIAATGDINGDGLGEVVVGSPGYLGIQLLDARSGAAFVYFSAPSPANISTTPVKLNAPSLLDLPGLPGLGGLLFGFSVDGAGNFSGDATQDIVVGAPGGISLSPTSLLGGSAYIFEGAAGTVNSTHDEQIKGTGPLLGSVANLFGYNVKGVKNANGVRTGNILVSAPSGSVLSAITNGLRLKTGDIYVFAAGNTTDIQHFSSPRGPNLITQLLSLDINVNALFGSAMDNMLDVNGDGIGDIIVGEPLSTGVGLVGINAVGGSAYIFTGNSDGTYNTTPYWTLENSVSFNAGINAGSLIGYSVAGGGRTHGRLKGVRAVIGAPGTTLDFSTGILALGNTLGTLFDFVAGDNGLGKAYTFGIGSDIIINPDVNVTHINVPVPGSVRTNDAVPALTTYGTSPVPSGTNPLGGTLNMASDGTYTFIATIPGVYEYSVPVCVPNEACVNSTLTITVLSTNGTPNPPIANTDIASTSENTPVTVNSLANDAAGNVGGNLYPSSVTVVSGPSHGTTSVNTLTGEITYTPASGYSGMDTLRYNVCDNSVPVSLCATAMQVFYVYGAGALNTTLAADDFVQTGKGLTATGNVSANDTDPEGNTHTVTPQNITLPGKGTLVLNADGSYTFTPVSTFTGPLSFTYTTCDNGVPQACAGATLYIAVTEVVMPDLSPSTRLGNGTFIESASTARDFVIEVNEINGNGTDNVAAPIRVRITKSDNFNYTFDPAGTSANVPGVIAVNNTDWQLVTNTSTVMVFELKPANNISALGTSRINVSMQVLPGASPGTENKTVSIINGSGKEVNFNNNAVVRILNIIN